MPILSQERDIDNIFLSEADMMNRFVGQELWGWGSGAQGSLGDNTFANKSSPVQTISGGTNWSDIGSARAGARAGGIKTDGTLWLWGSGANGTLGDNTTTNKSSPVQTVSGGTNWRNFAIAGGSSAVKTDGTLWTWGAAIALGDNSSINKSSPVQTVSGGTNWKQSAQMASAAENGVAAIKTDGTLWLWGSNVSYGRLADSTLVSKSSPVQTISGGNNWKSISISTHALSIKTDGTLWTWGQGTSGQLGNNSVLNRSSPIQTISSTTNWKSASPACASSTAIKIDGTLWTWGDSSISGSLGDNTTINKSSPIQTISGGTNWLSVSSGAYTIGGIKTDGTLWVWGSGANGALGNNQSTNRSSPVQTISGATNWRKFEGGAGRATGLRITGE